MLLTCHESFNENINAWSLTVNDPFKYIYNVSLQILHACMNLTTNEMFNYKRYPYLRDKRGRYQNPFSRGPIMNLIEFFVCLPDKCDEQDFFHEETIWCEISDSGKSRSNRTKENMNDTWPSPTEYKTAINFNNWH